MTGRGAKVGERLYMRPYDPTLSAPTCEVHGWPDADFVSRLVHAMRESFPTGVDVCVDCIRRAKRLADEARGRR